MMKQLWGLSEKKDCYELDMYNHRLFFCVALANFHILLHSLRGENGNIERNYMLRLVNYYDCASVKRKEQPPVRLAQKQACLNVQFGNIEEAAIGH